MKNNFIHLHIHSDYSILDGMCSIDKLFKKASDLKFEALAITDHGNTDAYVKALKASKEHGVSYIPGVELYIAKDVNSVTKQDRFKHMCALAKNNDGLSEIFRMLGKANEKFFKKPILDFNIMQEFDFSNIILTSACMMGILSYEDYEDKVEFILENFTEDFMLEVMPHESDDQIAINNRAVEMSWSYDLPIIATNDCHYIGEKHHSSHEVMLAINTNKKMYDKDRFKFGFNTLNFCDKERFIELFKNQGQFTNKKIKKFINNTNKVYDLVDFDSFKTYGIKIKAKSYNKEKFENLIKKRFKKTGLSKKKVYRKRLKREMSLIMSKGFDKYFYIVYDFVKYAKKNNIMVGPGRGSVGGSLLSYILGITTVDPIKFGLSFGRFISKDRIDFPDIDLDVEDVKREFVLDYLKNKYGENSIAGISTFGVLKAKGVVSDVSRVHGVNQQEINSVTKEIDTNDLATAIDENDNLVNYIRKNKKLEKHFKRLEGVIRSSGVHAAGVVIGNEAVNESGRGYLVKRKDKLILNWDKDDSEYMGFVKYDILGLNTLTVLSRCLEFIEERHNENIDLESLPLDDEEVLDIFKEADTVGIFQFSSHGMRKLLKKYPLEDFSDIYIINSLYRPGTLSSGVVDEYLEVKNGDKDPEYYDSRMYEEVMKETVGFMVFQEQMLKLLTGIGFKYSDADKLRKVCSKKRDVKLMKPYKKKFIKLAMENEGMEKDVAKDLFSKIEFFAKYSFNKCISGESKILIYDGRAIKRLKLKDAYKQKVEFVASYSQKNKKIFKAPIKEILKTGKKKTYLVVCKTNKVRKIRATKEHKFFTPEGWRKLKDLSIGDEILIKGPNTQLFGKDNPKYGGKPWNKGKSMKIKRKEENLSGYHKNKLSEAAIVREVHGHTGCIHSEESKQLMRDATLRRIENGDFKQTKTKIHKKVYKWMKTKGIAKGFINEYIIDNKFSVDIANPKLKIAIEINGTYWHADPRFYDKEVRNETQKKNVSRDKVKKKMLEMEGWELVVLWEDDINNNFKKCKREIKNAINDSMENPWEYAKIEFIGDKKVEQTYDIHVDHEEHNYIANMFVVHNSHAVEYSIIAYWTAYLKRYYYDEFMQALLSYGRELHRQEYLDELVSKGYVVNKVDINKSKAFIWVVENNKVYLPFSSLFGIGEKSATAIENARKSVGKLDSIYQLATIADKRAVNSKTIKILEQANAFNKEGDFNTKLYGIEVDAFSEIHGISSKVFRDFSNIKCVSMYKVARKLKDRGKVILKDVYYDKDKFFDASNKMMKALPENSSIIARIKSKKVVDFVSSEDIFKCEFGNIFKGIDINALQIIDDDVKDKLKKINKKIKKCNSCELINECTRPVPDEYRTNAVVLGEAPGPDEDEEEKPFIGKAGQLLWEYAGEFGLQRKHFSILNCAKCYPSKTRTPKKEHLEACSKYLEKQLKLIDPVIIFSLGATPAKVLENNKDAKITKLNNTIKYNSKYNAWVIYCFHPSHILRQGSKENKKAFAESLGTLAEKIGILA